MVIMSDSENEELIIEQARKDNLHFKALLNLVPAHSYFNQEEKLEIFGTNTGDSDEEDGAQENKDKKRKKFRMNPFTTLSVTEIIELRQKGGLAGAGNKKSSSTTDNKSSEKSAALEEKHKNKKLSRNARGNKNKGKEIERRDARLVELKQKLKEKLEEVKAKKSSGNTLNSQELKKLKRKEKKVNAKLKSSNKNIKEQSSPKAESVKSPASKKIQQQNGKQVNSKLDFSVISLGIDKNSRPSELRGRDYKRLLEKVEKRKEKIDKLKEKDMEAGIKLEEKFQWYAALSKAKGEKVKDDPNLLKKAAKRKDKMKDKRQRKWGDRVKTVDELKQKRQQKRQTNIDKRKTDKKDKKRKKMIKKGRILPGF